MDLVQRFYCGEYGVLTRGVGIRKMGEEKAIGDNTGDNYSTDIDNRASYESIEVSHHSDR